MKFQGRGIVKQPVLEDGLTVAIQGALRLRLTLPLRSHNIDPFHTISHVRGVSNHIVAVHSPCMVIMVPRMSVSSAVMCCATTRPVATSKDMDTKALRKTFTEFSRYRLFV